MTKWLSQMFRHRRLWLALSLLASLGMSAVVFRQGLGEYVVQDDARQHVFWMQRFQDEALFDGDLIADYFQSVAPWGYQALYRMAAVLGVDPFVFNKLLPPLLGLLATAFAFGVSTMLLPVPVVGFVTTIVLNLSIWMKDDVVSGTPRAFVYPLLTGFLYYLLRRDRFKCALAVIVTGLFYPQFVLVEAGVLLLYGLDFPRFRFKLPAMQVAAWGIAAAILVLLPYVLATNEFGPVIDRDRALGLADFYPKGRSAFFYSDPWYFWLSGDRSSLIPGRTPLALWAGVLLPILLQFPKAFPLLKSLRHTRVLLHFLVSAVVWFGLAHLFLFELHLPSRYSHHSLRVLLSVASGITVTAVAHSLLHWSRLPRPLRTTLAGIVVLSVVASPLWLADSFRTAYHPGNAPSLYPQLQATPKDSLFAGVDSELNNIPTFAQRPVLIGLEYMIPYHLGYYERIRQRAIDVVRAHYSVDLAIVQQAIVQYGIDYWVVRRDDFTRDYLQENYWLEKMEESRMQDDPLVSAIDDVFTSLENGEVPALATMRDRCLALASDRYLVLDAQCILDR